MLRSFCSKQRHRAYADVLDKCNRILTSLLRNQFYMKRSNCFGNEKIWFSDLSWKFVKLIDLAMKNNAICFGSNGGIYVMPMLMQKRKWYDIAFLISIIIRLKSFDWFGNGKIWWIDFAIKFRKLINWAMKNIFLSLYLTKAFTSLHC